jgi:DNA-binding MarR family transcriptional regulator
MRYTITMNQRQLQHQLSLLIIRSSMKSKYAIASTAEQYNITIMQALSLCLLDPGHSVPMKALSTFMGCDPSNVTGIIEQLVTEGLVTRTESPQDRRVKTIMLTDEGLELRNKFLEITTGARLPHFDRLTDEEIKQLIVILGKASATSSSESNEALLG